MKNMVYSFLASKHNRNKTGSEYIYIKLLKIMYFNNKCSKAINFFFKV